MRRHPDVRDASAAFTLFEVAVALLLVSVAAATTLLFFPAGLKAQQLARFRLYSAMKAEEIVDLFANSPNDNTGIDSEAFQPWDVPISYRVLAPDIEARISTPPYGIMPLPLAIARRLDSEGDEIQRVLDEGAYVYYAQATPIGQMREDLVQKTQDAPPSDAQKLVFAVVGCPQQNSLFAFPWKSWPYYAHYPSPPMHGAFMPGQWAAANALEFTWPDFDKLACYEGSVPAIADGPGAGAPGIDEDIRVVFQHEEGGKRYGYKPYAYDIGGGASPTLAGAIAYVQAALWYCAKKGILDELDPAGAAPAPLTAYPVPDASVPRWQQVCAVRFLAHAATCLTRYQDLVALGGQPSGPASGFLVPAVTLKGVAVPATRVTHDKLVFWHESCLALAMKFAAEDPYDWGAPRPMQRAIMTDYPLIQYDLFSPPLAGTLAGTAASPIAAEQWKPIPARPIRNIGVSWTYPDRAIGPADYAAPGGAQIWGNPAHFTLTAPFSPAERCRELVFWSVDWQAYDDFEAVPSAPVDASRYNIAAPLRDATLPGEEATFGTRMGWTDWWEMHLRDSRNPERHLLFIRPEIAGWANGTPIPTTDPGRGVMDYLGQDDKWNAAVFSGRYGADRNANGVLDRGPIPPSTRLRAVEVARFNVYDPRVPAVLR